MPTTKKSPSIEEVNVFLKKHTKNLNLLTLSKFGNATYRRSTYNKLKTQKIRNPRTGRMVSKYTKTGQDALKNKKLTNAQIEKYIMNHYGKHLPTQIGVAEIKNKVQNIYNKSNGSHAAKYRKIYNFLRKTKIINPATGKQVVRHSKIGKKVMEDDYRKRVKPYMANQNVINNVKSQRLDFHANLFGVKNAIKTFKNIPVSIHQKNSNGKYVKYNNLKNLNQEIRQNLSNLTEGQVTLTGRVNAIGEGVAGLVVKCRSNTKCNPYYKDLVLKISEKNDEWRNEVKILDRLTGYMKDNPKKDPLAPYMVGAFHVGNKGFILMQDARKVYSKPKPIWVGEWEKIESRSNRLKLLKPLKVAMTKLHKEAGIMHGNMHSGNVWFAKIPVGKSGKFIWKAYFVDFGRSMNYSNWGNPTNTHEYPNMANWIYMQKHPNINKNYMDDDKVYYQYKLAAL